MLHRLVALALHRVARLADEVGVGDPGSRHRQIARQRPRATARDQPSDHQPRDDREQRDDGELSHARAGSLGSWGYVPLEIAPAQVAQGG